MNKRIYDLAAQIGITTKELIDFLNSKGIETKNHLSIIDENINNLINQYFINTKMFNTSSLKYIEIIGLFEIYNYRITLENNINIFVAENGFGKTTILNIIVSLLKNDIEKLKTLPFTSIKIGLGNKSVELDKTEFLEDINYQEILSELRVYLPEYRYRELLRSYKKHGFLELDELLYLSRKYTPSRFFYEVIVNKVKYIESKNSKSLNKKLRQIQVLLKEDIVYFPTYRRIEEKFFGSNNLPYMDKLNFESELKKSRMHFGMDDVERIIQSITDRIKKESIDDYYKMSSEILDDLLSNSVNLSDLSMYNIDKEKIKIVIGRIGSNNIKYMDKLNEFIEKDSLTENERFITYFTYKLAMIYERQRNLDEKIKKFVEVSNKYLVNKKIFYNDVLAEVKIINDENGSELKFNQLSSGEKQIISLFSKLYLEVKDKVIMIIDEPELSLSILWQEMLIKDMVESGKIELLIATTHSPFIYKNNLEYTKELRDCRFILESKKEKYNGITRLYE